MPESSTQTNPKSSRSTGRIPLYILLLLLSGGAAWCGATEDGARFAAKAKKQVMELFGFESKAPVEAVTQQPSEQAAEHGRIKEEHGPHVVAAAISTGGRPADADPEAERNARIDKAVEETRQWSEAQGSGQQPEKIQEQGDAGEKEQRQDAAAGGTAPSCNETAAEGSENTPGSLASPEQTPQDFVQERPDAGVENKAEGVSMEGASGSLNAPDQAQADPAGGHGAEASEKNPPDTSAAASQEGGSPLRQLDGSVAQGRISRDTTQGGKISGGSSVQGRISSRSAKEPGVAPSSATSGASSLAGHAPARDADGSFGGRLEPTMAPADERVDPVVTKNYVREASAWLAASYVPAGASGGMGHTTATLEQLNARSGVSAFLRSHEKDPQKNRKAILEYVYSPGMLQALGQMYAPQFLDELEQAAGQRSGGALNKVQTADMFRTYARRFMQTAVSLRAAAAIDLAAKAEVISHHERHESSANAEFSRAYTAHAKAKAAGNEAEASLQSRRMIESSRLASMHAASQEQARREMARAILAGAEGEALPSQELSFLGEWLARRHSSPEAARAAAEVCRYLSEKCSERADAILNIGAPDQN